MIILEFNHVELDFCPVCRGCWMDRGELGLLLHGQPELPDDLNIRGETKSKRRCPRCRKKMRAGILPGTEVEMDICFQDGIWLDKGEPQAIAREKANTERGSAFIEFVSSVLGGWKREYE
jgi:Zn-finger nucleic acid-binding protein